jgi:uncharacterized integral membrane protein
VLFFLSNRQPADLNYWPFGLIISGLPLAVIVLVALAIGFLAGLLAHLPKRFGAQRRAKKAERRVAELEGKLAVPPAEGRIAAPSSASAA